MHIINVAERDQEVGWKEMGIDIVIEGTGVLRWPARQALDLVPRRLSRPHKGNDIPTYAVGANAIHSTRLPTLSPTPRAPPTAWRRCQGFDETGIVKGTRPPLTPTLVTKEFWMLRTEI